MVSCILHEQLEQIFCYALIYATPFLLNLLCADFIFYAVSHEELVSLLHDVVLLVYLGPGQERKWGTPVFLVLSLVSTVLLPPVYALFLFVTGDEASRICGFSGTQLALLAAQCRQSKQRRALRCLPPWSLPWLVLLVDLLLLPSAPGLLHFYAICLGLNCILYLTCCS